MLAFKNYENNETTFQVRDAVASMGLIASLVTANVAPGAIRGYIRTAKQLPAIQAAMENKGWQLSGTGYFSAVFVRGAVAVKIGLKKEDSGAVYAAWCRANQGKPGVPVIHAIEHFAHCYVAVMNRLHPLDLSDPYTACEYAEVEAVFSERDERSNTFAVVNTARQILEFFRGVAAFDLTRNNVMQDDAGNLVITDPVSYSADNDNGYTFTGAASSEQS